MAQPPWQAFSPGAAAAFRTDSGGGVILSFIAAITESSGRLRRHAGDVVVPGRWPWVGVLQHLNPAKLFCGATCRRRRPFSYPLPLGVPVMLNVGWSTAWTAGGVKG